MIDAPSTIYTLARYVARRTIRQQMQEDGYKPRDLTLAMLDNAARAWLQQHPEAFELAAERIANSPRLLALAKSEARQRERQRRAALKTSAPKSEPCSATRNLVHKSGAK